LRSITETVDDERREVGKASIWNGDPDMEEEHQPGFGGLWLVSIVRRLDCFFFSSVSDVVISVLRSEELLDGCGLTSIHR
jgi:hypothetical protein